MTVGRARTNTPQPAPSLGVTPSLTVQRAPRTAEPTDARALPDAPAPTFQPSRVSTTAPASLVGRLQPAVAGVLLATTLGSALAPAAHAQGVPVSALPPATVDGPAATQVITAQAEPNVGAFNDAMRTLEARHAQGQISADQVARARAVLYRVHVLGDRSADLPRDEQGRITLDSILRSDPGQAPVAQTRGQQVMDQLARDLESRMRLTARDIARGGYTPIDGLPGYKEIPQRDVQRLVTGALKRMPIGELPGGESLASLLGQLPGADGLDVAHMSYEELSKSLRGEARDWLKAELGPFIDAHRVESAVVAFAAVTSLRAASPDAAKLMDSVGVRIRVWRDSTDDGRFSTQGRLVYRDAHILPDLDIEGLANHRVGERTTLRAGFTGTLSLEGKEHLTGTGTVGAHYTAPGYWMDAAGSYELNTERWRATLTGGYAPVGSDLRASTSLTATFGDGAARGDASGRVNWELDLTKDLRFSGGVTGDVGAYIGASADTDGNHSDVAAGVMLRLRW
jgi:hypothetical protein